MADGEEASYFLELADNPRLLAFRYFSLRKPASILRPKTQKVLLAYVAGAAITAAIVVATIMSGIYYSTTLTLLEDQTSELLQMLKETQSDSENSRKVDRDTVNGAIVFYPKGPGIAQGTVAAIDYRRSITGFYDPESRECYLTVGLPNGSAGAMEFCSEVKNVAASIAGGARTFYQRVDDFAVQDHSVLPTPLQPICRGLPVYWMQKIEVPNANLVNAATNVSSNA